MRVLRQIRAALNCIEVGRCGHQKVNLLANPRLVSRDLNAAHRVDGEFELVRQTVLKELAAPQPMTVSRLTITTALRYRDQTRDSQIHNSRSDRRSGTRVGLDRSRTWSWCCKARISSCRAVRDRSDPRRV